MGHPYNLRSQSRPPSSPRTRQFETRLRDSINSLLRQQDTVTRSSTNTSQPHPPADSPAAPPPSRPEPLRARRRDGVRNLFKHRQGRDKASASADAQRQNGGMRQQFQQRLHNNIARALNQHRANNGDNVPTPGKQGRGMKRHVEGVPQKASLGADEAPRPKRRHVHAPVAAEVRGGALRRSPRFSPQARRERRLSRQSSGESFHEVEPPKTGGMTLPLTGVVAQGRVGSMRYSVRQVRDRRFKRLRVDQRNFDIVFNEDGDSEEEIILIEAYDVIYVAVERMYQYIVQQYRRSPHATIQFVITSDHLDPNVQMPTYNLRNESCVEHLMDRLYNILQSKRTMPMDESFKIAVIVANIPPIRLGAGKGGAKLGVDFQDPESYNGCNCQFMPEFDGDLEDTCLLTSMVAALVYNEELKACKDKEKMNNAVTAKWRRLQDLTRKDPYRKKNAREYLMKLVKDFCRDFALNPKDFHLVNLETLRPTFDRLNLNVKVYSKEAAYNNIFSHPVEHDATRQTVNLLVIHNQIRDVLHCGFIKRIGPFFHSKGRRVCQYCSGAYTCLYFKRHKCNAREVCKMCHWTVANEDDYMDYDIRKERCLSKVEPDAKITCQKCKKECLTEQCFIEHVKDCQKKARCDTCQQLYTVVKNVPHRCGDGFCLYCYARYNSFYDGPHNCQMGQTKLQLKYQPSGAWDVESYQDEQNRHRVNAVGYTWEDREKPGVFHERFVFDDDMQHEEDGIVHNNVYQNDYLPARLDKKKINWAKKPEKFKPFNPIGRKGRRDLERQQEEADEQADLDAVLGIDNEQDQASAADLQQTGGQYLSTEAVEVANEESDDENNNGDDYSSEDEWLDDRVVTDQAADGMCTGAVGDEEEVEARRASRRGQGRQQRQFPNSWKEFMDDDVDEEDEMESSAMNKFVDSIVNENFYGYVWICHNAARFDNILLLRTLMRREVDVSPIFDGGKLLYIKLPQLKMTFVDSYRYIKMRLEDFPKRFPGITDGSKGIFPYRFSHPNHYEYDGRIPNLDKYFIDEFTPESKVAKIKEFHAEFEAEYEQGKKTWNFKNELYAYLKDDIRLLRAGCVGLLKEFFEFQEGLPRKPAMPFHCWSAPFFTGSSFAHALFRYYSLEPNKVFLVTNQSNARKTSKYELEWLEYLRWKENRHIRTAFNHPNGQKRVGRFYLDGYEEATDTAYEFLGCVMHSHHVENTDCPLTKGLSAASRAPFGKTHGDVYAQWKMKYNKLLDVKMKVRTMWECEYLALRETDPDLQDFLDNYYEGRPTDRLTIRDGLRGGRTETYRLFYDKHTSPGRRMYYVDINSLYPTQAIFQRFPIGKPMTYIGRTLEELDFDRKEGFVMTKSREKVWGLIQAKVVPPTSLYLPALPTTANGRMCYGLCAKCLQLAKPGLCKHTDQERALQGTYTTEELAFAINECGYTLDRVYEAFIYKDAEKIFSNYYTHLARMKLQNEGYPADVVTEEQKKAYVDSLNQAMPGLNLDPTKVIRNQSRRTFAKDLSNIGLGKLSQNDTRTNITYCTSWQAIANIKYSETDDLVSIFPITPHVAEVKHVKKEARVGYHRNVQPVIYSFVTSYSRVRLLRDMRMLMQMGARIFYSDTDSIIFDIDEKVDRSVLEKTLALGSTAFGAYKEETQTPISMFGSLGPKNYSYTCEDGERVVKVRGFTLKGHKAKTVLTQEKMVELLNAWVFDKREESVQLDTFNMRTNRHKQTVTNTVSQKKYTNSGFCKRWVPDRNGPHPIDECLTSYPFGIKNFEFADTV